MIIFAIIISYLANPFSASVSSDPLIRHKHTYTKTGGSGCSLPLITLYKNKARQPLTLLVVWETRCNLRSVPGADRGCVCVREGGSVACKSMQTEHCEYITDEDIICELYTHRQQEGEVYRIHKTEKRTDEIGIYCCQG